MCVCILIYKGGQFHDAPDEEQKTQKPAKNRRKTGRLATFLTECNGNFGAREAKIKQYYKLFEKDHILGGLTIMLSGLKPKTPEKGTGGCKNNSLIENKKYDIFLIIFQLQYFCI